MNIDIALKIFIIFIIIIFLCFYISELITGKLGEIILYLGIFYLVLLYIDSLYISNIFSVGYGNKIVAIIMQSIFVVVFWAVPFITLIADLIDELDDFKINFDNIMLIIFNLIFLSGSIYTIGCLYCRLKLENILKIGWIDEIIEKCKNINIISNISKWLKSDYFTQLTITIIGGTASAIIAALILDKLRKNKNSHDNNATDKEKI